METFWHSYFFHSYENSLCVDAVCIPFKKKREGDGEHFIEFGERMQENECEEVYVQMCVFYVLYIFEIISIMLKSTKASQLNALHGIYSSGFYPK